MKFKLITNNKDLYEKVKNKKSLDIDFDENYSYLDVLEIVKREIQGEYKLATHPLVGSIKPNETPYRSILIEKRRQSDELDHSGIIIVDESIETYKKFQENKATPNWIDRVMADFRFVDANLLFQTIEKIGIE